MTSPDVKELAKEEFPKQEFPVRMRSEFRVFMSEEVHRRIQTHAKEDTSVEICGVLVGTWGTDENGPFAHITDDIRGQNAASKFAEVTFTHESWAQINEEMDSKHSDKRIIGWYHSHPDFGIFLSDRDVFIQQHFFSGPGQIAYVVDPVRDVEGVFEWRSGKPELISHYWVGNTVKTAEASQRQPRPASATQSSGNVPQHAVAAPGDRGSLDTVTTLLGWTCLFLLGYLLANSWNLWQRNMIVEGAVAHFGNQKVLKTGLRKELTQLEIDAARLRQAIASLPPANAKLSDDVAKQVELARRQMQQLLAQNQNQLARMRSEYTLSDAEEAALMKLVAEKHAALRKSQQESEDSKEKKSETTEKPLSKSEKKPAETQKADSPVVGPQPPSQPKPSTKETPSSGDTDNDSESAAGDSASIINPSSRSLVVMINDSNRGLRG